MKHVKSIMMKKISNIRKKNNKYIITLDDNHHLEFYSDTIIKYSILKPRELTDKELNEIISYNNYIEAYNKALKLINIKQRTKRELENKLKDYSKDIIDKVINKFEELNYINEEIYINSYINNQINLGNKGPIYIKRELEKLNLNPIYIDNTINSINNDIWLNKIEKIINKKVNTNNNLSKNNLILKTKNYLLQLGYELSMINSVLDSVNIEENNTILENTYKKELTKLKRKYEGNELDKKIKYSLYKKGFSIENIEKILDYNKNN